MQKFIILALLLLSCSFAYGVSEEEAAEAQPFIDTGKTNLPIAPEVISGREKKIAIPETKVLDNTPAPAPVPIKRTEKISEPKAIIPSIHDIAKKEHEHFPKANDADSSKKEQENPYETKQQKEQENQSPLIQSESTEQKTQDRVAPIKKTDSKKKQDKALEVNNATPPARQKVKPEPLSQASNKPDEDVVKHNPKTTAQKINIHVGKDKEIDPKQEQFIKDEAILLMFPDDEIVLGKLTDKAYLEKLDGSEYIALVIKNLPDRVSDAKEKDIRAFIAQSKIDKLPLSESFLLNAAIDDIRTTKLTDLRTLADNYNLIDLEDENGNNLLHIATFNNNNAMAKWLIMKGFDINKMNTDTSKPIDIASYYQYWQILSLLEAAGAK